jgi:hypothetical protein
MGCLAGPVGTDDGVHAVAGKAEVDAIDSKEAAELAAETAGFQSVNGGVRHAIILLVSGSRIEKQAWTRRRHILEQKFPIVN